MSKYSNEFKLEVVTYYLNNNCGWNYVANHFNIPAWTTVRKWVRKYNEHGPKGLVKTFKSSYSGEFKQNVIEYMHTNHLSAKQTAAYFNLDENQPIIWERIYYEEGPQALYEERRGRPRKKKNVHKNEDLLEEVQRLRMENEYLKKLNALVQERIKRENKKK